VKEPGLDDRHRDVDGEISRKHSNTKVGTLRDTYGQGFASGVPNDANLKDVLDQSGAPSLSEYLKRDK
jgi:hypothetical protein